MSTALELAGRYPEAIAALKLYLTTNPKDGRAAQDKIYAIEGEQERAQVAAKQREQEQMQENARQQAIASQRQAEASRQQIEDFLNSLRGKCIWDDGTENEPWFGATEDQSDFAYSCTRPPSGYDPEKRYLYGAWKKQQ